MHLGQCVAESTPVLVSAGQDSQSRDKELGQGIVTLFKKPEDRGNGGLGPLKNHLTRVRIQASFLLKGGRGVWLVTDQLLGARILCSCGCLGRSDHKVPVNLHQDNCYFLLCHP